MPGRKEDRVPDFLVDLPPDRQEGPHVSLEEAAPMVLVERPKHRPRDDAEVGVEIRPRPSQPRYTGYRRQGGR